jgi:hypothetical protein
MTWPIVELAFWNEGDVRSDAIDRLLVDPSTPLAKHGLTGVADAYATETGAPMHEVHRDWASQLATRSLGVDGALAEVIATLDEAGVDHFVAKGPVLAHWMYRRPAMRPYCDLDVYVPAQSHELARAVLRRARYEPVEHAVGTLGGLGQELHGGRFGATVEVHAHVIDNLHRHHLPPVEAFLPFVERRRIGGVDAPVLEPGAHLALQAIHAAAGHRYAKLVHYRDIELTMAAAATMPEELGAEAYLAAIASVLTALGRPVAARGSSGTLARPLIDALVKRDAITWDEYRLSVTNVLALLHQRSWATSGSCAVRAARGLVRRRPNARVPLGRALLPVPAPRRSSP